MAADSNNKTTIIKTIQPAASAPKIVKPAPAAPAKTASAKPATTAKSTSSSTAKPATKTAAKPAAKKTTSRATSKSKTAAKPAAKTTRRKPIAKKTTARRSATAAKRPAKKPAAKASAAKAKSNVVSISRAARSGLASSSANAKKIQSQIAKGSAGSAQQLAKGANIATKVLNESIAIGREHTEACTEASNIAAQCAGKLSETLMNYANDAITESVEISKDFFSCRTASDVFELQSRLTRSNTERFLDESSKMMEMMFDMTSKAAEPFGDYYTDATDRLQKAFK